MQIRKLLNYALGNWMQLGLRSWEFIGSSPIGSAKLYILIIGV